MIVNGKQIDTSKFSAQTLASQAFTKKFWIMDRILFNMSPFLTFEESDIIMTAMEKRAQSRHEGNWTTNDCLMFLRELLGNERWNAIEQMWEMNNQQAIIEYNAPETLREAWVHKLTMTEETDLNIIKAKPASYVLIKTIKG
jgi:hypothetical protein